jgi:iron complex outermembrane receptor protein
MVTSRKTKVLILIYFFLANFAWNQELSGRIMDSETNEPILFAKVSFPSLTLHASTDSLGYFYFTDVPMIRTKLKVVAFGYETYYKDVLLSEKTLSIKLDPQHTVFEEVTVSAVEGKLQRENITAVEILSRKELFATGATTLGDALNRIPGVQSSSVGMGISKPVIRGLSGMRVITYNNGLRIENQQWGQDHGLGASMVGLDRVEVVKGPSSLMYGADALGGVIQFIDEGYVPKDELHLFASTRFESNSMGTISEVGAKMNNGKIKLNLHANFINHGDFQLPDGQFIQNSRFWGTNFKANMGYRKNNYVLNIRYQMAYNRTGIPGHSHNENPSSLDFIAVDRGRQGTLPAQFNFNNYLLIENQFFFNRSNLLIQLGNTNASLREHDEKVTVPFTHLNLNNSTYNVRYDYHITDSLTLKSGVQGMVQLNRNFFPTESFLIPDANTIDNGAYSLLHFESGKWDFQAGMRYDVRNLNTFSTVSVDSSITQNISIEAISRTFNQLNYAAGFVRNAENSTLRFNVSSGFRAPHLAELGADGFHHGSLRYERGDANLNPENALQIDAALELHYDHFEFIVNPYFNRISNFIYLFQSDQFAGSFPIFEFRQASLAYLYGGEAGFHFHPHNLHRLHVSSTFSLTIAEQSNGTPLNLIPQPNINSLIRFEIGNKHKISVKDIVIEHEYFLPQNRVGQNELANVDYHLINVAANLEFGEDKRWSSTVGVRNLLNTAFIGHLSALKNLGLHQPGINFFGSIRYNLVKPINK